MQELAKESGVPFTTLWKIRDGTTGNPGIETVRKFYPSTETVVTPPVAGGLPIDRTELAVAIKSGLITDERQKARREADRKKGGAA